MFAKPKISCVARTQLRTKSALRNTAASKSKITPLFHLSNANAVKINNGFSRHFATDDSAFHPDFKTIKKQYENNKSPEEVQNFIKEVGDHSLIN